MLSFAKERTLSRSTMMPPPSTQLKGIASLISHKHSNRELTVHARGERGQPGKGTPVVESSQLSDLGVEVELQASASNRARVGGVMPDGLEMEPVNMRIGVLGVS